MNQAIVKPYRGPGYIVSDMVKTPNTPLEKLAEDLRFVGVGFGIRSIDELLYHAEQVTDNIEWHIWGVRALCTDGYRRVLFLAANASDAIGTTFCTGDKAANRIARLRAARQVQLEREMMP